MIFYIPLPQTKPRELALYAVVKFGKPLKRKFKKIKNSSKINGFKKIFVKNVLNPQTRQAINPYPLWGIFLLHGISGYPPGGGTSWRQATRLRQLRVKTGTDNNARILKDNLMQVSEFVFLYIDFQSLKNFSRPKD